MPSLRSTRVNPGKEAVALGLVEGVPAPGEREEQPLKVAVAKDEAEVLRVVKALGLALEVVLAALLALTV